MYCPGGSSDITGCPTSYYCPSPEEMVICPAGKYCPFKTDQPYISCRSCGEGEESFQSLIGLVLILTSVLVLLVITFQAFAKNTSMLTAKKKNLASTRDETMNLKRNDESLRDELMRLKPILVSMQEKIEYYSSEDPKLYPPAMINSIFPMSPDDKLFGENIDTAALNASALFDYLDVDMSGDLTYYELNVILSMNTDKLRAFMRVMNSMGGQSVDSTSVSRDTFCDYFLETILLSQYFEPTEKEARELFQGLCASNTNTHANTFNTIELYTSNLRIFLKDVQINNLLEKLRIKDHRPYDAFAITITEDEFVSSFPEILKEITADNLKSNDLSLARGIDLKFEDLSLTVTLKGSEVDILQGLSGRIQGGSMVALLGGSGAGKTSLLNALCGRAYYGNVHGDVYINGQQCAIDRIKDATGFVPQDDIVYADLTVRENLLYAGRFKLPAGTSDDEVNNLVDHVLASLGLSRACSSITGFISSSK